jgi:hypothetical protein
LFLGRTLVDLIPQRVHPGPAARHGLNHLGRIPGCRYPLRHIQRGETLLYQRRKPIAPALLGGIVGGQLFEAGKIALDPGTGRLGGREESRIPRQHIAA